MAVSQQGNVVKITANADTFDNKARLKILGIKLVGNGTDASTVVIKDTDSSGQILYSGRCAISADLYERISIKVGAKIYVELTGTGSVVYVYTE